MGAVGVMLFLEVHADSKMKERKRVRKVKENRTMTNKNIFLPETNIQKYRYL